MFHFSINYKTVALALAMPLSFLGKCRLTKAVPCSPSIIQASNLVVVPVAW